MTELQGRIDKGGYTPDDLRRGKSTLIIVIILCFIYCTADLNRGPFREEAERLMASLFRQTKFRKCHEYLQGSLADCADRFGRLKAAAISLCEIPGAQLQGVSIAGRGKGTYNYLYTMHTISTKALYVSVGISITMHTQCIQQWKTILMILCSKPTRTLKIWTFRQ